MTSPSSESLDRLRAISVPTLSAALYKKGYRTRCLAGLRPTNPSLPRLCGPAHTLRAIPAREDIVDAIAAGARANPHRQGLDRAPPGSVVILATGGHMNVSVLGDVIVHAMLRRGVAGVVADAGASDWTRLSAMSLPVFATGSCPIPFAHGLMFIDQEQPVGCAGVAIFPGDIIVGDGDGVVCVPAHMVDEIAAAGRDQDHLEEFLIERINRDGRLDGVYPPNPALLEEYRAWRARR